MELFTSWHSWPQAEAGLRELLPPQAVAAVGRAVAFAARQHGDQRRPTGAPYAEHLLEALQVLARGAGVTAPARQRAYYAQTIEHIVPLAGTEPWFRYWYASWRAEFADLATAGHGGSGGSAGSPGAPAGSAGAAGAL